MLTKFKGFFAYITAALAAVIGSLTGLASFVKLPKLSLGWLAWPPTGILATAWAWLAWGVGGLWRSFWAAWGNPLTYPILGFAAFVAFSAGHHEGFKRGTARLGAAQSALSNAATVVSHQSARINALEAALNATKPSPAATPATVAPVPAKPTPAPAKPKRVKAPEKPAPSFWSF